MMMDVPSDDGTIVHLLLLGEEADDEGKPLVRDCSSYRA
jgi:hypothetical protein